jgi:hypothetical protein
MTRLLIGLFLTTTLTSYSQKLHDEIHSIYNFSPGKLTREEQDKKIPLMDDFWNKVKSDTATYLKELRHELDRDDNPKFFYFDGGQLLLTLSKSKKDKELVLNGVTKCDITDIAKRNYVGTLNYLAKSGLNTTDASLKILEEKDYGFIIVEHAFNFNMSYCLTYCLLPTNPDYYVSALIDKYNAIQDIDTKKAIVTTLWFTNSCDGNGFLKKLSNDKDQNSEIIRYTNDLLTRKLKKDKYFKPLDKLDFDGLTRAQINSTNRMSDEAIHELDYITKLLRLNNCR